MDWRGGLVLFSLVFFADGFSKYGRSCKDIGCLNSEVCVLAEDPCSFGQQSQCGTYPTCKKKSLVEGSHSDPVKPPAPKPTPKPSAPSDNFDTPPHYAPPAPPPVSPYGGGSPYGGSTHGGSPYGGTNGGGSPYGGSNGGGSPYGGSNGGGSPYGGSSPYGGTHGGGSPYDSNRGGGSPYGSNTGGGSPYGGSSGGGSPYGGNLPYGGNRGGSPYDNPYGGSKPSSSGGKSPIDSILNTLNKYASGGGGSGGSGSSGSPLSSIFGSILSNFSKGGIGNSFNTRPIYENPNYSSQNRNNHQNYPPPSYQQTPTSHPRRNYATTTKPVSYGWNIG